MNIANITAKFSAFSGLTEDELVSQGAVIESAVEFITAHSTVPNPTEEQTQRLETLCAAYAYRLYDMCNGADITSFTAGDVKITSSGGGKNSGEKLWQETKNVNGDLIQVDDFIFRRM